MGLLHHCRTGGRAGSNTLEPPSLTLCHILFSALASTARLPTLRDWDLWLGVQDEVMTGGLGEGIQWSLLACHRSMRFPFRSWGMRDLAGDWRMW